MATTDLEFLTTLEGIIRDRIREGSSDSYTARLVAAGPRRIAQKIGEEGVELAIAGATGDAQEQLEEAADLIYHLLILLATNKLGLADVVAMLERRHRQKP